MMGGVGRGPTGSSGRSTSPRATGAAASCASAPPRLSSGCARREGMDGREESSSFNLNSSRRCNNVHYNGKKETSPSLHGKL